MQCNRMPATLVQGGTHNAEANANQDCGYDATALPETGAPPDLFELRHAKLQFHQGVGASTSTRR